MAPCSALAARPQHVTCCSDHSCSRHRHGAAPMVAPPQQHQQAKRRLISAVLPQLVSLALAGQLHASELVEGAATASAAAATDAAAAAAAAAAAVGSGYVPSPVELGWEIYFGAAAGVIPFIIASYEFGKRILIQRRCPECQGSGLVKRGRYLRKCAQCGGMLPWMGWSYFFFGTADPGNGGPLLQPRGQTSVFYKVPPPLPPRQEAQQAGQAGQGGQAGRGAGVAQPAAAAAEQGAAAAGVEDGK